MITRPSGRASKLRTMEAHPTPLVTAAIARLMVDDPLALVLIAAALREHPRSFDAAAALAIADRSVNSLLRARALARSRRERQHLSIVECWLAGDEDRTSLLAREHLASFPNDVVVSWLVGRQ